MSSTGNINIRVKMEIDHESFSEANARLERFQSHDRAPVSGRPSAIGAVAAALTLVGVTSRQGQRINRRRFLFPWRRA